MYRVDTSSSKEIVSLLDVDDHVLSRSTQPNVHENPAEEPWDAFGPSVAYVPPAADLHTSHNNANQVPTTTVMTSDWAAWDNVPVQPGPASAPSVGSASTISTLQGVEHSASSSSIAYSAPFQQQQQQQHTSEQKHSYIPNVASLQQQKLRELSSVRSSLFCINETNQAIIVLMH